MFSLSNKGLCLSVCFLGMFIYGTVRGQEPVPNRDPTPQYPYVTSMDHEGDFILKWNFDEMEIQFQIQVHTLGYVAFGISESGLMVPADVVVGYVDGTGATTFGDFHTVAYAAPVRDASQDWTLVSGQEVNGWTVLEFRRRLDTCDATDDRPITANTLQLIYAFDAIDPTSLDALFHHDKRGFKPVNLLTRSKAPSQLPAQLQTIDFRNENYVIPSDRETSYFCRVFNRSDLSTKYHAVKISPLYTTGTEINVHHMVLYRCKLSNPAVTVRSGEGSSCFTDAPDHIQFCREYVAGFGSGGEDMYLPEDVGLPIGGVDEADIYVLAIHYDNVDFAPGLVDNSGIRITVTTQLRQHEGAFLSMGNIVSQNWLQFIPPGESSFVQKAYCSQRCLAWGFQGSGSALPMTLAGVQFQSHELGKQMRVRHMTYVGKDRVRENPWVAEDKSYSSDAQSFRVLKERKQVGYWDSLLLECTYDSTSRDRFTVGGWTNYDELCRAYVLYYPRKAIDGCMSWTSYNGLRNANGRLLNSTETFPTLAATDWANDPAMKRNLRQALDNSVEYSQCWSTKRKQDAGYGFDYFRQPRITNVYTESQQTMCPTRRMDGVQMFGK